MTTWSHTMCRLSDKLPGTGLYLSIDRPSLQFAMSVVMSGMSEPRVVHQLQVVRVARYVLDPKSLYVYTDTDWAADELTGDSVSCTVERYGSHMLDCSVAKRSLVALSSGEAEFDGFVRAVATSKANLSGFGTDRSASGGDHCIRQQCSTRNLHENGKGKGATPFDQRVVDTRVVSQERVPVGVGGHVAEPG